MNKIFLIKYGELSLKKANKKAFIKQLINNIKNNIKILFQDTPERFPKVQFTIDDKTSSLAINYNAAFPEENR